MSYNEANPLENQTTNPVGTQEFSGGVATAPTPNPLIAKASEDMHEAALRDENFKAAISQAVSESVTDMFALKPNWKPKHERIRFVIHCPSGQTVLARHLNTMDLLEANLIEELDFFTKKLFPSNIDPSGNPVEDEDEEEKTIWNVLRDIDKRRRFIDLLNRLIDISVEKPRVINDNIQVATRSDGTHFLITGAEMSPEDYIRVFGKPLPQLKENETYASAVDFTDKMTIFGELNKPLSVIQPFRDESLVSMASMEPSESFRTQT